MRATAASPASGVCHTWARSCHRCSGIEAPGAVDCPRSNQLGPRSGQARDVSTTPVVADQVHRGLERLHFITSQST